ncbi:AAA family ATPase [Trichocoleus desertorum AS-A10]|uniref:nSTAND1 domain-containing NTPase n=1 Tax=Trichocoleus desertorum TaxID=1481672 RepID=UPI003299259C
MSTDSGSSDESLPVQQDVTGDRNQIIGQAVSSTIVNVTGGGQITIYQSQLERSLKAESEPSSTIGPNPYKGLMAFQETDGDRFFGREKQIEQLWNKLRELHEEQTAVQFLPIYGPSGSGKSSRVRAGLIPELARHPLPGYARARVAVLVPGTHPLEALATVLARVATDDQTPVAKTREFAGELEQANQNSEYDGLRRIADVLPDIALSPLIVLVDQFEEVYTLCTDPMERDRFIGNLMCAASERSKRVSVIVTLRSDFLEETQKHPELNALFAEQGFLVRAMNEAELRQAIAKPAELAGYPLDMATTDLLIKDTEGREGALPLLQFALERIWEGLAEGNQPAETLKAIGGVGGALAGEAQRIYQRLNDEEQEIARRVFLGLVQLGEGTKDTRRRVRFDSLVSYQNQPEQVKRVIQLFSAPGARLITLAAAGNTETAEVSHEALFDHWQQLQTWVEGSRSDIRFQRRLDEAVRYWDEQGRPEGNLWRSPDLDLLKQYQQRSGDDMTPLQIAFFGASKQAEENRGQKERADQVFKEQAIQAQKKAIEFQRRALWSLGALLIVAVGLAVFAAYQLQQAQRQRVEQLAATSKVLLPTQPVEGAINAIAAVGLSQAPLVQFLYYLLPVSVHSSVLESVQLSQEQSQLQHEDAVISAAFSPDGNMIVSGSRDKTVGCVAKNQSMVK